jgi:type I restriction enzyme S subunit
MRKYDKYKSSGIDWIGEIPKDWNIKRLKEIANVETGNTPSTSNPNFYSEEGMPWIKPDNLNDFIELTDSAEKLSENGIQEARVVRKGAVLVCCIGTIGKIGIAGCDLATNQQINSVEFYNKRILDNYGKYLLYISEAELVKQSNKVVVSILNKIKQSQIKFPIPSIEEQLSIANYLDYQTQKIDCLIANKKGQAEKLKELRQIEINNAVTKGLNPNAEMKDSGINWLGEIPKHWAVKRLKNVADINSTKQEVKFDDVKDLEVVFLPMENVSENGAIDNSDKRKASEIWEGFTYFKKNDVIIAKITPCFENGKGAWLSSLESEFGFGSTEFHTVRGHKNRLDNHYFYHVTKSDVFMKIGEAFMTGSAGQKRVSTNFVLTFKLAFPPIDEQIQIAKFLQERTTAIDKLISNIDAQIEKLLELRKIKIYEAVTGKIKVNAYVEATA